MPDNKRLAPTHAAIREWRKRYFAGHIPAIGYPSENSIYRMMRGTALTSGADTYWATELEALADEVQAAVAEMRDRYDSGAHARNLHEPFIAHHLHVIKGERAHKSGEPMPPGDKARKLKISIATYYRRIDEATDYVHVFIDEKRAA